MKSADAAEKHPAARDSRRGAARFAQWRSAQHLEGIAIGSYAIGCELAFVYIRGEYTVAGDNLRAAVDEAKKAGLLGRSSLKKADGSDFVLDVIVFVIVVVIYRHRHRHDDLHVHARVV